MKRIDNFKSIIDKYKIVFFDAFGVIKTYSGLVHGIEKTFAYLEKEKKEYYIVTNDASRSPVQLAESFHRMGLTAITPDRIVSSGMLTKEYLDLKVEGGIVAYLGTPNSVSTTAPSSMRKIFQTTVGRQRRETFAGMADLLAPQGLLAKWFPSP